MFSQKITSSKTRVRWFTLIELLNVIIEDVFCLAICVMHSPSTEVNVTWIYVILWQNFRLSFSLNTESKEERRIQDKFDKEAAKHEQPDYDEKFFNVHIKLLQTDRRNKNVLTLSRSVVKTLQCKLNRDHFEEESDEFFQKPLDFLFHLICSAIRFIHDKIDEDNIEGTTGIWQVSHYKYIMLHHITWVLYHVTPYHMSAVSCHTDRKSVV